MYDKVFVCGCPACVKLHQTTHRVRRGVLVEIPEQWRGVVTHKQTIRKRKSKLINKRKREYN